ncbi:hypothetical protein EJD97_015274 [Solanum chilense]|uniref:Uncharacterized protein n=1 Tax=Solanum chilense TaxID=4083 RepID=A0A6N2B9T2_SOLCI|nr:hypothetical protein EJD97_015274 [Solanum chilense]
MPPRKANAMNVNTRNANASPHVPDQEVSNTDFRNAIQMLAQSMTNRINRVFPDRVERSKVSGVHELEAVKHEHIKYWIKFNQLSRYSPHMVDDSRTQMNKFLYGVLDFVKPKCRNAMLLRDMNISRLMTHAQQVEAPSSANVPSSNNRYDQKVIGYQALSLMEVFQAPRLTPLALSVVRTTRASVSHNKNDVLGSVNLGNSSVTDGGQRQNRLYSIQSFQDHEGSPDVVTGQKDDLKGYLYNLVWVKDSSSETPTLEIVPVVYEFPKLFPEDLYGVPLKKEMDLGIDILPDNPPISIPPYIMAPVELKELKE